MEKGENAGNQHFLLFPQRFLLSNRQVSLFDPPIGRLPMFRIWPRIKMLCNGIQSNEDCSGTQYGVCDCKSPRYLNDKCRNLWHFLWIPDTSIYVFRERPVAEKYFPDLVIRE